MGPSNGSDCPRGGQVIACFDIPRGGQLAVVATQYCSLSAGRTPLRELHRRSTHSAGRTTRRCCNPTSRTVRRADSNEALVDSSSIPRRGQSEFSSTPKRLHQGVRRADTHPHTRARKWRRKAPRALSAARTPTNKYLNKPLDTTIRTRILNNNQNTRGNHAHHQHRRRHHHQHHR